MKTKFAIATDKQSPIMNRAKAVAERMLQFKTWNPEQRQLLEKIAKQGYVVADIWKVLDVFGLRKSYNSHQNRQVGIVIPLPSVLFYSTKTLKKSAFNVCLL
jgi:hypothetical protein